MMVRGHIVSEKERKKERTEYVLQVAKLEEGLDGHFACAHAQIEEYTGVASIEMTGAESLVCATGQQLSVQQTALGLRQLRNVPVL